MAKNINTFDSRFDATDFDRMYYVIKYPHLYDTIMPLLSSDHARDVVDCALGKLPDNKITQELINQAKDFK